MQDRLERLERDLSMLQRQVYRSGGVPVITAGSNAAVDTEIRMDRIETEMRDLTGRVENLANGVEQLRRRLEQINSDIDVRFGQGQSPTASPRSTGGSSSAGTLASRSIAPTMNQVTSTQPDVPLPSGTLVPPPYAPTGVGTLRPPDNLQRSAQPTLEPVDLAASGALRPPSGNLSVGSASEQYNFAFGLLKKADYSAAEEAMRDFISQHPNNPLAGSAQYWLGETHYARGNYSQAAVAFAEGYKRYPKGPKAADDLLKLGMSLARANQKQDACVAFAKLDHDFPNPGSAIKERAKDEKKKLGC